jgi:hypothetical protein
MTGSLHGPERLWASVDLCESEETPMLYLVHPDTRMSRSALSGSDVLNVVRLRDVDLAPLHWEPLERIADDVVLRLALRRGVACSTGIVIDGELVRVAERPAALRRGYEFAEDARRAAQSGGNSAFMEQIHPGWTKQVKDVDGRFDGAVARALSRAERTLADELDAVDPDAQLVEHWLWLNGRFPAA